MRRRDSPSSGSYPLIFMPSMTSSVDVKTFYSLNDSLASAAGCRECRGRGLGDDENLPLEGSLRIDEGIDFLKGMSVALRQWSSCTMIPRSSEQSADHKVY